MLINYFLILTINFVKNPLYAKLLLDIAYANIDIINTPNAVPAIVIIIVTP